MEACKESHVKPKHITLSYPSGDWTEYALECLIPAINEELDDYTVSCSSASKTIQDLIRNPAPYADDQLVGSIQWSDYDLIDWSLLKSLPDHVIFGAYPIRKALIRKNYLIKAIEAYHIKNQTQTQVVRDEQSTRINESMIPKSYIFSLSYSDELDELWMDELYELNCEFEKNERDQQESGSEDANQQDDNKRIWILKPALADKGQGIRLFSTKQELHEIFQEFERIEEIIEEQEKNRSTLQQEAHDGEERVRDDETLENGYNGQQTWVSISQMRDWIIQEYISNPLLISPDIPSTYSMDASVDRSGFHKHHLRVYVLAVGALSVYVFEDMLSLFSSEAYTNKNLKDLRIHLTNTCLQGTERSESKFETIRSIQQHPKEILDQIDHIVKTLFQFVAKNDPINFQLFLNCFEIFGFDFLIDDNFKVWLLEVNAGPDFSQTGEELKPIIKKLYSSMIKVLKSKFPLTTEKESDSRGKLIDKTEQLTSHLDQKEEPNHRSIPSPDSLSQPPSSSTTRPVDSIGGFRMVLDLQTNLSLM